MLVGVGEGRNDAGSQAMTAMVDTSSQTDIKDMGLVSILKWKSCWFSEAALDVPLVSHLISGP